MSARGFDCAPGQEAPRLTVYVRHWSLAPEQPRGQRYGARAVAQRVRELHDRYRRGSGTARNVVHRNEDVHAPGLCAGVELVAGKFGDGTQAAVPVVVV